MPVIPLRDRFRLDVSAFHRDEGRKLFQRGAVDLWLRRDGRWEATVTDPELLDGDCDEDDPVGDSPRVVLPDPRAKATRQTAPTCPCRFARAGIRCMHIWAAILEADWIEAYVEAVGKDDELLRFGPGGRPVGWVSDAARREALDPELLRHALGDDLDGPPTAGAASPSAPAAEHASEPEPSSPPKRPRKPAARPPREAAAEQRSEPTPAPDPAPATPGTPPPPPIESRVDHAATEPAPHPDAEPDPRLAPGPTPLGDWRERFAALTRASGRRAWRRLPTAARQELRYWLDPVALDDGELRLFPQARARGGDGAAGKWRAPQANQVDEELLLPEDRAVLARYLVLQRGTYGWAASVGGVPIDPSLLGAFAALVRRGAVAFGKPSQAAGHEALGWHDGDFEPVFRIERQRHTVSVGAELRERGGGAVIRKLAAICGDGLGFDGERFVAFRSDGSPRLLAELLVGGPSVAPRAEEVEFLEAIAGGVGSARVEGLDAPRDGADATPPRPRATIAPPDGRSATLAVDVGFRYGDVLVAADDPAGWVRAPARDGWLARDLAAETAWLAELVELGGFENPNPHARSCASIPAARFDAVVRELVVRGWEVFAAGRRVRRGGAPSLRVTSGIDWFRIEGEVDFDGVPVALPEVLANLAGSGPGMVQLGDGSFGLLPDDWLARWQRLLALGEPDAGGYRLADSQAWLLDALAAAQRPSAVELDAAAAERRERLASFARIEPRAAPPGFGGQLRDYQRAGLGWLWFLDEFGLGGCLADDMGLGKTVQVLAHLLARRGAGRAEGPSLVIAPRSVVFNWKAEAARFAPALTVLDWTGADRWQRADQLDAADLVVSTYGTIRRDAPALAERRFDYVILDEAQTVKNASSQASKAVRALTARRRLAMSGTPVENHLGELWALFEFLNPGMLGRSAAFAELCGSDDGAVPEALREALRPFLLRRTKEQVLLDLPDKTEQVIHCELSGRQQREYEESRRWFDATLRKKADDLGLNRMKIHVLEALLRLRQLACHPALVDPERRGETSAKLDELLPRLEEIAARGHKALVFSQFTTLLDLVEPRLEERGLAFCRLDGGTAARRREAAVQRFQQDPACPVFLVSLKAGGTGLNLTAADYVFLLDPWWNPAVEAQAIDRAHRIGRTRPVIAYRLIAKDTIEDRVLELQARKRELADQLFAAGKGPLRGLTREDLERLFSA